MTTQVLVVPKWVIILRGIQLFLATVVLGLSAYGVHWIAFNAWGFAIFCSLATYIVVLYGILTERIPSWNTAYNYWAIVALDAFLVVFWLSAMGALAATRALFIYPTTINGCINYGSGGICYKKRDLDLAKRDSYVATNGYLSMMSGAAGISALLFVLFVVTLVMSSIALHRHRKASHESAPPTNGKVESHPMSNVHQQQPQYTGAPAQYEQPPPANYQQPPPANYQQPPPPANY